MTDELLRALTIASAVGAGLVAGVFFAFSTFVMKALGRIPPAQGIAAMQSINVTVINPLFMTPFLGTAATSIVLGIFSLLTWQKPGTGLLLAATSLYLFGTLLVTILFNVPRNNVLASVDPTSAEGARVWADYLTEWTVWNHVRTAAALVASVLFTLTLLCW